MKRYTFDELTIARCASSSQRERAAKRAFDKLTRALRDHAFFDACFAHVLDVELDVTCEHVVVAYDATCDLSVVAFNALHDDNVTAAL